MELRHHGAHGDRGTVYAYGPDIKPSVSTAGEPRPSDTSGDKHVTAKVFISMEDALKSEALIVTGFDPRVVHNAIHHWTMRYQDTWADLNPKPVVRRGREVSLELTFNRPWQKRDEVYFVVSMDEEDQGTTKNIRATFRLEPQDDGECKERSPLDWWAVADGLEGHQKGKVMMHIPGNCAVGYWHLRVRTRGPDLNTAHHFFVFLCPQPFAVLFNPWSPQDQVYFTDDVNLLDEYVLNDQGVAFMGVRDNTKTKNWYYGQFEAGVVDICLWLLKKAFNGRLTQDMGNPVLVSRALSKIVNAQDDQGVLQGSWLGDYSGGTPPVTWSSSLPILREYYSTQDPVKFGQCWVFAHTLTTVCRALGLPCRSVTNYNSAHDSDSTCTVDVFLDNDGDILQDLVTDSIWNFHVWTEVWMLRPDLPDDFFKEGYDGWHVIDATPQELSLGLFQCGPCPVKAVKRGDITVGFDTAFVFSEVNAEVVDWIRGETGEFDTVSAVRKDLVGCNISTLMPKCMKPEGFPEGEIAGMDITGTYKYPEGSEEERTAVKRAVRYCRYGSKLFKHCSDLEVTLKAGSDTAVGSEVRLSSVVKNVSGEDREVDVTVAARSAPYWDHSRHSQLLAKQVFTATSIRAGQSESFELAVTPEMYLELCDDHWTLQAFACARDLKANMPYTCHQPFTLTLPHLRVQGPESARSDEPVQVSVSLTNPLAIALTQCSFRLEASLQPAPDEPRPWAFRYGCHVLECGSDFQVGPSKEMTLDVLLVGTWSGDPEENSTRTALITFQSKELGDLQGTYTLKRKTDS